MRRIRPAARLNLALYISLSVFRFRARCTPNRRSDLRVGADTVSQHTFVSWIAVWQLPIYGLIVSRILLLTGRIASGLGSRAAGRERRSGRACLTKSDHHLLILPRHPTNTSLPPFSRHVGPWARSRCANRKIASVQAEAVEAGVVQKRRAKSRRRKVCEADEKG